MNNKRLENFIKDLNIKLQNVIDEHEEELLKIVQEELPKNHFIVNGMGMVSLINGETEESFTSSDNDFVWTLQSLLFYEGINIGISLPYFTGGKYTLNDKMEEEIKKYVGKNEETYPYFKKYILTGNYK